MGHQEGEQETTQELSAREIARSLRGLQSGSENVLDLQFGGFVPISKAFMYDRLRALKPVTGLSADRRFNETQITTEGGLVTLVRGHTGEVRVAAGGITYLTIPGGTTLSSTSEGDVDVAIAETRVFEGPLTITKDIDSDGVTILVPGEQESYHLTGMPEITVSSMSTGATTTADVKGGTLVTYMEEEAVIQRLYYAGSDKSVSIITSDDKGNVSGIYEYELRRGYGTRREEIIYAGIYNENNEYETGLFLWVYPGETRYSLGIRPGQYTGRR